MRLIRPAFALPALFVASLASCGGHGGELVRPKDLVATDATGVPVPSCTGAPQLAKPLVVDLAPDSRVDLEAAMKKGVAIVAYDCKSLRVLPACRLDAAGYEYAGVSRKEQVVQVKNEDELSVNLPLASHKFGGSVRAGNSIDLALVLVGLRSTTVGKVARERLTGECGGATHFLQTASLGAFSMATGSAGKVAAMAELFKVGASGSSESSRQATNRDGSLEACRKSDPDAPTPPAECRAPIRVELMPLGGPAAPEPVAETGGAAPEGGGKAAKKEPKPEENPCRPGYHFADGLCTRSAESAHLCDPKNVEECKAQCEKGNGGSCFNYAASMKPSWREPYYKKACDGGVAEACYEYALMADGDDGLAYARKGCSMGSGGACSRIGYVLRGKEEEAATRSFLRGCALGDGDGCSEAAKRTIRGTGVERDIPKGLDLLSRGCDAGLAGVCAEFAEILSSGRDRSLGVDLPRALTAARRACEGDPDTCSKASDIAFSAGKNEDGFAFLKRSCDQLSVIEPQSCERLADLYTSGRGTPKDPAQAKEALKKACNNGFGSAIACKKVGIKPKK
jgi:uncharacterized protein